MKELNNNQRHKIITLLDNSEYHELGYGRHIFFCEDCFDNVSQEEYDFSNKRCISCCKKLRQKAE